MPSAVKRFVTAARFRAASMPDHTRASWCSCRSASPVSSRHPTTALGSQNQSRFLCAARSLCARMFNPVSARGPKASISGKHPGKLGCCISPAAGPLVKLLWRQAGLSPLCEAAKAAIWVVLALRRPHLHLLDEIGGAADGSRTPSDGRANWRHCSCAPCATGVRPPRAMPPRSRAETAPSSLRPLPSIRCCTPQRAHTARVSAALPPNAC